MSMHLNGGKPGILANLAGRTNLSVPHGFQAEKLGIRGLGDSIRLDDDWGGKVGGPLECRATDDGSGAALARGRGVGSMKLFVLFLPIRPAPHQRRSLDRLLR